LLPGLQATPQVYSASTPAEISADVLQNLLRRLVYLFIATGFGEERPAVAERSLKRSAAKAVPRSVLRRSRSAPTWPLAASLLQGFLRGDFAS
jgi:hypothetical protein